MPDSVSQTTIWFPIATAPRDYTILGKNNGDVRMLVAFDDDDQRWYVMVSSGWRDWMFDREGDRLEAKNLVEWCEVP